MRGSGTLGHAKSRGQHLTEAEGRGVGQDTHSSSPVARGSSFCPDLCGGCGALQLAPVSVLWLLCPWQCTGIWGAMTGPSRTKSPYLPRTLQRKKKGAGGGYSFPCPVAAKSRGTTKSWKDTPSHAWPKLYPCRVHAASSSLTAKPGWARQGWAGCPGSPLQLFCSC